MGLDGVHQEERTEKERGDEGTPMFRILTEKGLAKETEKRRDRGRKKSGEGQAYSAKLLPFWETTFSILMAC